MPRTFALSDLVTRCKRRADMENDGLVSDPEWKGYISSLYARLYSELVASGMREFEDEQELTTAAEAAATGTLVAVAQASLVDGETFTLHDGYGPLTFEFDVAGDGVTVGHVQVDVSGDTTATQVGDTIETAVDAATHADGTAFRISSSNSSGTVTLTHDSTGPIGNQKSYNCVANTGFSLTDMTGGGGNAYPLPARYLSTVGVDYAKNGATGERRHLNEIMAQERNIFTTVSGAGEARAYAIKAHQIILYPTPPANQTYYHVYYPQPVDLSSAPNATVVDVATPDGEEFILWGVAVLALAKEESDVKVAQQERELALERVREWAVLRAFHSGRRRVVDNFAPYDHWQWSQGDL